MKKALLLAVAVLFSACKEKDVTVRTEPKSPEAAAEARDRLTWTLPKGWREEAGEGMRYATVLAGPTGRAYELSIIRLAGGAGGALANVNRWREQLRLPPIDENGLKRASSKIASPAGEVIFVDLLGHDGQTRILGAMVKRGDSWWFFKMAGARAKIAPFASDLKSFLKTLRPS